MRIYQIYRKDKNLYYEVAILQHKADKKFSYINLTKGHICQCKFDTYEEALREMMDNDNVQINAVKHVGFIDY